MPPKRDAEDGGGGALKKSRLSQKTAAEFFAENKQFAGEYSPRRWRRPCATLRSC
jgi:hypothetical protein